MELARAAIFLCIVLISISAYSIFYNYFYKFNGSDRGYKNLIIILLALLSMICGFIAIFTNFDVGNLIYIIENEKDIPQEYIQACRSSLRGAVVKSAVILLSGIISYIIHRWMLKNSNKKLNVKGTC